MTNRHWPQHQHYRYYLLSQGRANTYRGDGALSASEPVRAAVDRFDYDPFTAVPTIDLLDQRPVEVREDVLCYTSPALTEPVRIAGAVELVVFVTSSIPDGGITGKLVDVGPDDSARFITDGIARVRRARELYELHIDLGAATALFASGHRIRLDVSGGSVPKYAEPGELPAVNRIHHGPRTPSRLLLPVAEH
ncbi:CocE/NonD family hydrolase [Catenulispora pinisilvae]|uniref:CocE/NonD family hydrolase n=1 Tax=Catenulispora pinisilvae TaxID=2705253 RepID=UPI0018917113|nr:CocE/NonD family hydrolase [Catenulispora pinisilvae]